MLWSADQVAWFAVRAGFRSVALDDAVALALVLSGGDDAWIGPPANGAASGERGLWAIDVARHPETAALDLFDPYQAARAAFDLYTAAGWPEEWVWARTAPGWADARQAAVQGVSRASATAGWTQPPADYTAVVRSSAQPTLAARALAAATTIARAVTIRP